jgi:hypothetical protein
VIALATLIGLGSNLSPAAARITTEESASILVFPKVIADGTRDTIIQITNTSNNMRHAHCFYVNAAPSIPGLPISDENPPLWTEIDFDITLTKQQPTKWVVSTGRRFPAFEDTCAGQATDSGRQCDPSTTGGGDADCCDAGFDPGRIPPSAPDFTGELKCVEVDASGFPVGGNALKGEATLVDTADNDVSKYNAIGLKGFDTNNMDGTLCLGGGVTAGCPTGAEYEACPRLWVIDHPSDGAINPVADNFGFPSEASATLTVVPCTQNFETQAPEDVTVQFLIMNEFEQVLSASTSFQCWASWSLNGDEADSANPYGGISTAFEKATIGTDLVKTTARAVGNTGVMMVVEETNSSTGGTARSAQNVHTSFQDVTGQDIITIPGEQIQIPEP